MEITVSEQVQRFYLAFDEWKAATGHEIKVGEYRFCAIPLSEVINISEVTSGLKVLELPIDGRVMLATATKDGSMKFFMGVGKQLEETIRHNRDYFQELLVSMRKSTLDRLGEMPSIEKVGVM